MTYSGGSRLKMYSFQDLEGEKVNEALSGEDGRLSFLGRRLTFKVDNGLELHFQQSMIYSSKFEKQGTNLSLVTQHPDSTQDIVEIAREDGEDGEDDEDNQDDENVWLTEEQLTNTDCLVME